MTRASQVYNFPINLSTEIQPGAIFYGTVVPVAVFWVVKVLIVNPFLKMEKQKYVSFVQLFINMFLILKPEEVNRTAPEVEVLVLPSPGRFKCQTHPTEGGGGKKKTPI